ncbi:MAG: hypothetical protein ACK5JT_17425 [Hyphomicrobiaceae bacterium]
MFKSRTGSRAPNEIDLETVRETLLYMSDDVSRNTELAPVAAALVNAIAAIDKLPKRARLARPAHLADRTSANIVSLTAANFVRWQPTE